MRRRPAESLKRIGQRLVLRAGIFDAARGIYHIFFNRSYRSYLREQQRVFEQFVKPGSLVFDLGANRGEFSLVFSRIGARVISVEPNPPLAERLRLRFGRKQVVEAAVGAERGRTKLYLGVDSNYSTVSTRWKPVVEERGRLSQESVDVDITTLDELISEFGVPTFVKVDVEGHELEVFRGLSTPIDGLLFEFQCPLLDDFDAAVAVLEHLASYEFGIGDAGFINWMSGEAVRLRVRGLCGEGVGSGDIYVRRRELTT